jgi:hypothetical protein
MEILRIDGTAMVASRIGLGSWFDGRVDVGRPPAQTDFGLGLFLSAARGCARDK